MNKISRRQKAFTLIELLVVISIISLLSSVVLASVQSAREKARMAKAMQFAANTNHAIGHEMVGSWSFDEGSGNTAYDSSGFGNNGSITGATFNGDTPYDILGQGEGRYSMDFDGNDNVNLGNVGGYSNSVSIVAWVKHSSTADWDDIVAGGCGDLLLGFNANRLSWGGQCNSPFGNLIYNTNINTVWHHVAATYDGSASRLYVDGILVGQRSVSGSFTPGIISIGSTGGGSGENYIGLIDDVRIYSSALSTAEIQKHYAEGLPFYQNPLVIK